MMLVCIGSSMAENHLQNDHHCRLSQENTKFMCKSYQAERLDVARIIQEEKSSRQVLTSVRSLEFKHGKTPIISRRAFFPMKSISHLVIYNMSVTTIEMDAFEGLSQVKLLDLSHNNIRVFQANSFKFMNVRHLKLDGNPNLEMPLNSPLLIAPKLQWLSLKHCGIEHLPGTAFSMTPHLSHLDLSSNRMDHLPQAVFKNTSLKFLDLSHNNFVTLRLEVFEQVPGFPRLPRAVILTGNRWHCGCALQPLVTWLAEDLDTHYPTSDPARSRLQVHTTCTSPQRFAAVSWNKYEEWNCQES